MVQKFSFILVVTCVTLAAPSFAGDGHDRQQGWGYTVGAGVMTTPTFLGDDEQQIMVVPNIRVTYEDKFFVSIQEGVGYNLIHNDNWRVGPIARLDFGRDQEGNSPFRVDGGDVSDLRGLREVDSSIELGAFAEYSFHKFSALVEVRQATGGHDGLVGQVGVNYNNRTQLFGKPVMYNLGPDIAFADTDFHQAYFGVNAPEAGASGLPVYDPGGGVLSYGFGGMMIMPLTQKVSMVGFAGYDHLGDEAANSSLVDQRGSPHQGAAGLFLNYNF